MNTKTKRIEPCNKCAEGWICEAHPDFAWPHGTCTGAGMPCDLHGFMEHGGEINEPPSVATPRPWRVVKWAVTPFIHHITPADNQGWVIASLHEARQGVEQAEANAALIVAAVNDHDALAAENTRFATELAHGHMDGLIGHYRVDPEGCKGCGILRDAGWEIEITGIGAFWTNKALAQHGGAEATKA